MKPLNPYGNFFFKRFYSIVMEYADSGDLEMFVKARRGSLLKEEDVMQLFVQLCLAIKYIHDRKILHRDLKSQVTNFSSIIIVNL